MYVDATLPQVETALCAVNAIFEDNIQLADIHKDGAYVHCRLRVKHYGGAGSRIDRSSYAVCRHVLCVFVQALPLHTIVYIKPNLRYQVNREHLPYDYDGVHCNCSIQDHINSLVSNG